MDHAWKDESSRSKMHWCTSSTPWCSSCMASKHQTRVSRLAYLTPVGCSASSCSHTAAGPGAPQAEPTCCVMVRGGLRWVQSWGKGHLQHAALLLSIVRWVIRVGQLRAHTSRFTGGQVTQERAAIEERCDAQCFLFGTALRKCARQIECVKWHKWRHQSVACASSHLVRSRCSDVVITNAGCPTECWGSLPEEVRALGNQPSTDQNTTTPVNSCA